jgi:MFS family permease
MRRRGAQLEAKALWLVGSTLAAAGIGCAAGLLQVQRIAPVGLLPVAVGLAVAMAAERLGKALGLRIGLGWLVAAIAWALLAIVAEVYIGHWDHVRDVLNFEQNHPKAAVFTDERSATSPAGLLRYFLSRFEQSPILLTTDAGLTLAASIAWIEYRRRRSAAARTEAPES